MADKLKHRWFRFGVRTTFVAVALFASWLGWQTRIVRQRKAMLADLEVRRVEVTFTSDRIPVWRRWLGDRGVASIRFLCSGSAELAGEECKIVRRVIPEADFQIAFTEPEFRSIPAAAFKTDVKAR